MKRKAGKVNSLLFTVLLALIVCLTGCVSQTDSGESVSASTAETPETIETEAPAETKTLIRLKGRSASCEGEGVSISGSEIVISEPGEYELSGTLKNGGIKVLTAKNAGNVTLILNNARISCEEGPAIEELEADRLILVLPEGTKNTVHSGGNKASSPDPDASGAAIQAEDAIVLEGGGNLAVEGFLNNAIAGRKELSVFGGTLQISASNCGVSVAKYIEVRDGNIQITAGNDGLRTHSAKVSGKGDVDISGSTLKITAGGDGIAAEGNLVIAGGRLDITTDGDPEIVSSKGVKAEGDTCITDTVLTVLSCDNALHGKGGLLLSGGEVKLRSTLRKGIHYAGAVELDGSGTLDVQAEGNGIETDTDLVILNGNTSVSAGGDGLRAGESGTGQGTIRIDGGTIYVSASNDALDAKIRMTVNGGTVFAAGNSYRLRSFSVDSRQTFLCAELENPAEEELAVCTQGGEMLDRLAPAYPARTVHFSSPALKQGSGYELQSGSSRVSVSAG